MKPLREIVVGFFLGWMGILDALSVLHWFGWGGSAAYVETQLHGKHAKAHPSFR